MSRMYQEGADQFNVEWYRYITWSFQTIGMGCAGSDEIGEESKSVCI
jgi:hypothetical protein